MDYDYLTSIVSNYTNYPQLAKKMTNSMNSFAAMNSADETGSIDSLSSLDSARAYTSLQDAMASLQQNSTFSTILNSAVQAAGISEEAAGKLRSIAAVDTDNALESEARSNLIMQNYLYAALIQESLKEQVSENGDFTASVLQGLALGDDSAMQKAATAIQNMSLADTLNEQSSIEAFV